MCNKQISLQVDKICKFTPTKTSDIFYKAYVLHNFMAMQYVVWNYLCVEIF